MRWWKRVSQIKHFTEIWFYGSGYFYDVVVTQFAKYVAVFRRDILPPPSEWNFLNTLCNYAPENYIDSAKEYFTSDEFIKFKFSNTFKNW
jgi:hypothetical protein